MEDKRVELADAAKLVQPGSLLAISGRIDLTPMAFVRELVRQGARELDFVAAPSTGLPIDLLIGAGAIRSAEFAQIQLEEYGLAPNFRRAAQEGRLTLRDHT